MRVSAFVDTNVLVYGFSDGEPGKRDAARSTLEEFSPIVSTQVLSELACVLTRKFHQPSAAVAEIIRQIANNYDVVTVDAEIVRTALRVADQYRLGFYDSQIIAAALASGTKILLSEDLQHGQVIQGVLTIRSPFALAAREPRAAYKPAPKTARKRARTPV